MNFLKNWSIIRPQIEWARPGRTRLRMKKLEWFLKDWELFQELFTQQKDFQNLTLLPALDDKNVTNGSLTYHYFYQDLFVAQCLFRDNPHLHVDFGSRIDGFVAHVASFRTLEVLDIRPMEQSIPNVLTRQADLMGDVSHLANYADSVSSLHVIEHLGLGRYGDPININGHLIGLENIHKILKPGGKFYFATPFGPQRIEFNTHRIFNLSYLMEYLIPRYEVLNFAYVDDGNNLHPSVELTSENIKSNLGQNFACAIFELRKK
jgi:SAM-dependent methyltransferase